MRHQLADLFFVPMPFDVYPDDEPHASPDERSLVQVDAESPRDENVLQASTSCVEGEP